MQMGLMARTPAAREMAISSGSEQEEEGARSPRKGGSSKKKKKGKHMTEEEMEAMQGAKGARKAKEWLDSGFGGYKRVSALYSWSPAGCNWQGCLPRAVLHHARLHMVSAPAAAGCVTAHEFQQRCLFINSSALRALSPGWLFQTRSSSKGPHSVYTAT